MKYFCDVVNFVVAAAMNVVAYIAAVAVAAIFADVAATATAK